MKAGARVDLANPTDHDRTAVYRLMINNLDTTNAGMDKKEHMLRLLVKAGADINHQDDQGMTPLHALIYIDCDDTIEGVDRSHRRAVRNVEQIETNEMADGALRNQAEHLKTRSGNDDGQPDQSKNVKTEDVEHGQSNGFPAEMRDDTTQGSIDDVNSELGDDLPRGQAEYFKAEVSEVKMLLKVGALRRLTDDRGRSPLDYVLDANSRCGAGYSQEMVDLLTA